MKGLTKKLIYLIVALVVLGLILMGVYTQQPTTTTTTLPKTTTTILTTTTQPTATTSTTTTLITTAGIKMKNLVFDPSTVTVKKGTIVVWTNEDSSSHTVISDSGNELNSPIIQIGKNYSHTFNTVGTFNYHCSIHSSITGTVVVE